MEPDRTPIEARGAVISGRVITLLLASFAGTLVAMAVTLWIVGRA